MARKAASRKPGKRLQVALALATPSAGIAFLVSGGIVAEFIAKDVSSPQTTELNADKRAPTLMKWVHVGQVEAAVFIAIAIMFDRKNTFPILAGAALAMVVTEVEYLYAKQCGLNSTQPPTEDW
jgi:hypothetical protein